MKITKSQLKQIIKEELNEALPPHLQSKVDAYEKKKQKYSITDVTPPGYGPDEDEEKYTPGPEHHAAMQKASDALARAISGDDEEEPLKLRTPKEDPLGRGAKTSRLRRNVGGKGTGRLEEDHLEE